MSSLFGISLDDLLSTSTANVGSLDKAIGSNIRGIDPLQLRPYLPSDQEQQGYTFFVRPQLNLSSDNCRNMREFIPLVSDGSNTTIHRAIRCLLDPRLGVGYRISKTTTLPVITCPLVDNENCFIPMLSNNLLNISGWPDLALPTFKYKEGRYNESMSIADGLVKSSSVYTLDATFKNSFATPILYLSYIYTLYAQNVFAGLMVPYPDFIAQNRIDYNLRIWRIGLDYTKTYVTSILSSGPAVLVNAPIGHKGDYNVERQISEQGKDITLRFECCNAEIFDPILIKEFNKTVYTFNPSMADDKINQEMILVPQEYLRLFRHYVYPRINPKTHYFEWWVKKTIYEQRKNTYSSVFSDFDNLLT